MAEEPDAIREEIERTRERLEQRADALAYKADVPARSKERAVEVRDRIVGQVNGVLPSRDELDWRLQRAKEWAKENPVPAALLGLTAVAVLLLMVRQSASE